MDKKDYAEVLEIKKSVISIFKNNLVFVSRITYFFSRTKRRVLMGNSPKELDFVNAFKK